MTKRSFWYRLTNNILSRQEALMLAVVLIGLGIAVGLLF